METAPRILIFKSLTSIMNEVEPIGKNKRNSQQGFMYRGIDDMYNELQPIFSKHKVFITSEVLDCNREERPSKSGGVLLWTVLKVRFSFYAEDGSSVSSIMVGEAMDSGDKGANKAMSIALKYCLMQLLLIPTEEAKKDDNDGYINEPAPKKQSITDKAFKTAIGRIDAGEKDLIQKLKDSYTLNSAQMAELAKRENNSKPVNA